ncbi:LysR family transcriptional regulator [Mameliella alba]|nr:LysR family transcriptional regulator [Mameliella alba]MBY6160342.1 LysR family transcriptional regulator [Mameliella alba]MBY6168812.1 LysR family transcriptional regulator [Mameliella alba]MBY6173967.1 LysR family transcriptional regulator [Mameliella alba]MCA0956444.1 LysR family transcriptional regulator [Mameliella alba]
MDLKQLKYFLSVVEHKSFSAAAEALNVTHPALGQQVRKLEDELGLQLFERHSRGVRVSAAGARLIGHARDIVERFQTTRDDMASFSSNPTGRVRVGVTPALGRVLVPALLEHCSDLYPDLQLHLVQGYADHLERRLKDQELDVSIVHSKIETPHIESLPLFVEKICLIGRPGLLAGLGDPVEPEALTRVPLILDERGQLTRTSLEGFLKNAGDRMPKTVEVQAVNIRREFVMRGTHCALAPRALFFDELNSGEVEARDVDLPAFTRTLGLATPRVETMSRSIAAVREAFVDLILQSAEEGRYGWQIARSDW